MLFVPNVRFTIVRNKFIVHTMNLLHSELRQIYMKTYEVGCVLPAHTVFYFQYITNALWILLTLYHVFCNFMELL